MAITNHDRIGKGMELLREGLAPFVEREILRPGPNLKQREHRLRRIAEESKLSNKPLVEWDVAGLLRLMSESWFEAFASTLGYAEQALVTELRGVRNDWAHQRPFSSDDTDRALDSTARLLTSISAAEADDVTKMKLELRRVVYDEQVRGEKRKTAGTVLETGVLGTLTPWREIVTPHKDVASGKYQQAEFAADLWQVYLGEGSDEYRVPEEFYQRTYLTESLKRLLVNAVQRVAGQSGDPVVQLQTNFGGGKTHSMLALYHLFSGASPDALPGVDDVLARAGVAKLPAVRRVVLVGNKISPGSPVTKQDGTVVRTLWGELAYQLGGRPAFDLIRADDEHATSPGDALRELFKAYSPCIILIDEWVAYARMLHDSPDLPAGTFETQFTFAQVLTESAKAAPDCLLVISLPASDDGKSGGTRGSADDVEVGGERGREALNRLGNVIGRVESAWRPATAEESFEIVRRRLFQPLADAGAFKKRDVTARAFGDLYRSQGLEFPSECGQIDYEKRIQAAFPIHPEVFDRLYTDWSTLLKFQRTRGVLRLMAGVIHSLWERGDRGPLIMPSTIPLDDSRVQTELTRYLSDNWAPIIEKDVDGPNSLPLRIDAEQPNLGKLSATRRVARTIFMGSAPTAGAAHQGLEDARVKLGCVMPGESPSPFGDALRRLAASATYLYQDGSRFWYDTQPTVTKLAEDRAEQLKRDRDKVVQHIEARVRTNLSRPGAFVRIHPFPGTSADVPDDYDARLVVLAPDSPYTKEPTSPAEGAAQTILESRGNTPRLFRNTLVFLAADQVRLQDLEDAARRFLAWDSILEERERLDLSPFQVRQAETQHQAADSAVVARLPETYQWLLVPDQGKEAQAPVEWGAFRLTGSDSLAERASKRLRSEELLLMSMGSTILRKYLDDVPLWRGNDVPLRQLIDEFARYLYLPRLASPEVVARSVSDGVKILTWRTDTFAYAEGHDEAKGRYLGLQAGQVIALEADSAGVVVKPEVALRQLDSELLPGPGPVPQPASTGGDVETVEPPAETGPHRFHGVVRLDPARVGRDASQIADEVVAHLVGQVHAEVIVTLEIEAHLPNGASEQLVRTVNENSVTLKFKSHGFERE